MEFTFEMYPSPPFHFTLMTRRLLANHRAVMYRWEDGQLYRTIRIGNRPVIMAVKSVGSVEQPVLRVTLYPRRGDAQLSSEERRLAEFLIREMFSADVDLSGVYGMMMDDPVLRVLARRFFGLRIVREPDLFEAMVKTIIGQQLNLSFAAVLTRRLVEEFGESMEDHRGRNHPVFPTSAQIALLSYEELLPLQFSRRKAEYVIDFARECAEGRLVLEELRNLSDLEVTERLISLRGIGRWSVECFLIFGMGRPDLLPVADIGLRNGIKRAYKLDQQPSLEETERLGNNCRPWRSYFTYYMWELLASGTDDEAHHSNHT